MPCIKEVPLVILSWCPGSYPLLVYSQSPLACPLMNAAMARTPSGSLVSPGCSAGSAAKGAKNNC